MLFRLNLPLEIDRCVDGLSSPMGVTVQVVCLGGKWQAQCQDPPVATLVCDTLEEALMAAAREIQQEWKAATTSP